MNGHNTITCIVLIISHKCLTPKFRCVNDRNAVPSVLRLIIFLTPTNLKWSEFFARYAKNINKWFMSLKMPLLVFEVKYTFIYPAITMLVKINYSSMKERFITKSIELFSLMIQLIIIVPLIAYFSRLWKNNAHFSERFCVYDFDIHFLKNWDKV